MKKTIVYILTTFMILGITGIAGATSGTFMFTMSGNDSNTDIGIIQDKIDQWFAEHGYGTVNIDLNELKKIDDLKYQGGYFVDYLSPDQTNGTWGSPGEIQFYSVKAGTTGFAFYWLNPTGPDSLTSGTWSTEELTNKHGKAQDLSHITFWGANTPSDFTPVPEPASMLLLGIGMLVSAPIIRKKMNKSKG